MLHIYPSSLAKIKDAVTLNRNSYSAEQAIPSRLFELAFGFISEEPKTRPYLKLTYRVY